MKRCVFKKKLTTPLKKTVFKRKPVIKKKRIRLPSIGSMQKKCDSLLTPIVKKMFPRCMLCGMETQVAHHFVHKSKASALRYEIDNLINLCNKCHCALHHSESFYSAKIIQKKGIEWFSMLEKQKYNTQKIDRKYYETQFNRLKSIYEI